MPENLEFELENCKDITVSNNCDESSCNFTCTPTKPGKQQGAIKDSEGNILHTFNVNVIGETGLLPDLSQCSTYDLSATSQLTIPCVDINGQEYSVDLNLVTASTLHFKVNMETLEKVSLPKNENCAVYPYGEENHLYLNCVQMGDDYMWMELNIVPDTEEMEFEVIKYDKKY